MDAKAPKAPSLNVDVKAPEALSLDVDAKDSRHHYRSGCEGSDWV